MNFIFSKYAQIKFLNERYVIVQFLFFLYNYGLTYGLACGLTCGLTIILDNLSVSLLYSKLLSISSSD